MSPDEDILFLTDNDDYPVTGSSSNWRILVVDDDAEVHQVTRLVLGNTLILGCGLDIVDTYSMAETKQVLQKDKDFAVVLLDVVMETPSAGLDLIIFIRKELGMDNVRIILRTGQPGYAPELEVFSRYDINDYHAKTELTHARLMTAMTSALRAYQQIQANIESRDLMTRIVMASATLSEHHTPSSLAIQTLVALVDIFQCPVSGLFATQNQFQIKEIESGPFDLSGEITEPEPMDSTREVNELRPFNSTSELSESRPQDSASDLSNLELYVTAGTGRFRHLAGLKLSDLNPDDTELVKSCLELAQDVFLQKRTALYLYGNFIVAVVIIDFDDDIKPLQRQALQLFSANLASAYASANLFQKLSDNADLDLLTRLSNRQCFIRDLDDLSMGDTTDMTLAVLDIDHFADLNDGLGQEVGDSLLRAVAERLTEALPNCSTARLGGDVFAMVGANTLINDQSLLRLFDSPCKVDDNQIPVNVTLGLYRLPYTKSNGQHSYTKSNGQDMLKSANIALNRAKKSKISHFEYFLPEMEKDTRKRLNIVRELRVAFDDHKLDVWYQPQVCLATGRVSGMEALIRWPDGRGGFVYPPVEFIELAEHSGLIVDIGLRVLEKSAETWMELRSKGLSPERIAVNVSMPQFRTTSFVKDVAEVIECTGLPASCLELEITESIAMDEPKVVQQSFHDLKEIGVRLAIDDFGTGYSSMGHLRLLPINTIKIDQMFVREIANGQSIFAESIITLSKRLGVETIAEGVETQEQADFLLQQGCRDAQGWLYAKAMPKDELEIWLKDNLRHH
ncbi:MAG: EAL domain-containing protein [Pseudomonadales bacterium]|nr:EAL domain-containing protein [Pseudomonadales bacterium]